jgi:SRSO17 transposase
VAAAADSPGAALGSLPARAPQPRRQAWLAYYVVYAPRAKARLATLAKVAGRRWEIEIGFEATKSECGLDQYEVRRWQGWYVSGQSSHLEIGL